MNQAIAQAEARRLEGLLGGDPAGTAFPALAEVHRRAGDPQRAEELARAGLDRRPDALAGRVALGLALLDLGRTDEARAELERVLASVPDHPVAKAGLARPDPGDSDVDWESPRAVVPEAAAAFEVPFDEPEIDAAFADATPQSDEMFSANRLAERAILDAELHADDGLVEVADFEPGEGIPVATHTVANLLERQGHAGAADAIRSRIEAPLAGEQERILATLERWLENLRGGRA